VAESYGVNLDPKKEEKKKEDKPIKEVGGVTDVKQEDIIKPIDF
jgi:hypothetical protein